MLRRIGQWGKRHRLLLVITCLLFIGVSVFVLIARKPPSSPNLTSALSSSNVTGESATYDGQTVEVSGQTYLTGSSPRVLVDGKSGINLSGNIATLEKDFYRLTGEYNANTNTLNVIDSAKEEVTYLAIEAGKKLDVNLVPVALQGLIATTPKEVANVLTSYLSIPNLPQDVPIYPYVVYANDGFYLVLSDTPVHLPAEFVFLYGGMDYSFTFCAGEVKGTLVKTPLEKIKFGTKWQPDEFGGVIIANTIAPLDPIQATVKEINANPANYAFKRVLIKGDYIVTTVTIDYSEIIAPMGQGILADEFGDFFKEDTKARLETIDPNRTAWQLRRGNKVIGTVIYPTEQILKYLDYSEPLTKSEMRGRLKPALIVDTLVDEVVSVAEISELNPILGNPSKYWGRVVEFDGYALGFNYPLKNVAEAILKTEVPVNVNLLAVGIADKPAIGSQLAIIGLDNELKEKGELIIGKYRFRVAVTHVPEELVGGVPYADTAFFLLSKEKLPEEIPTPQLYTLSISIDPSGAGSVTVIPPGGQFQSGTIVSLTAIPSPGYAFDHWGGDVSGTSLTITVTMDSDKSVTAYFKPLPSTTCVLIVSVSPTGSGTVLLMPPGGSYPSGTVVALTAVPALGYAFDHWGGDVSGTSLTITVTMDSDKSVTAYFKR